MSAAIVLVTFYSRSGSTETLALSHAVGAVQARALIRLRRLPDAAADAAAAAGAQDSEPLRRMQKEYVPPAEADLLNADAIVIAPPSDARIEGTGWAEYFDLLTRLGRGGKLAAKVGAVVGNASPETMRRFSEALLSAGLIVVPAAAGGDGATPEAATSHGRRVATVAQTLKPVLARLT